VLGVIAFLAVIFKRKRARGQCSRSPYAVNHEPKRRDSYPQPIVPDSSIYISSKDIDTDTITKSQASLDSDFLLSPKSRARSSRASSSIFADDNATVNSRINYLRPLSLGESPASLTQRGMQMAYGPSHQVRPLFERSHPNTLDLERQLSPIPGTPATPGIVFAPAEPDDEHRALVQPSPTPSLARSESRSSTPPIPATSLPALPRPPILSVSYSPDVAPQRHSRHTLLASSSGPGFSDSRPQSMVSVYSTRTQDQGIEISDSLSPDVIVTLERLKKRVSTPWSVHSTDTYRFDKTEGG
jgi:hypothetical protein